MRIGSTPERDEMIDAPAALGSGEVATYRFASRAMASPLRLAVHGPAGPSALAVVTRAWSEVRDEFERSEQAMSRFRESSGLTRVNRAAGLGLPLPLERRLRTALVAAWRAQRMTAGRFDPRVLADLDRLGYRGVAVSPETAGEGPPDGASAGEGPTGDASAGEGPTGDASAGGDPIGRQAAGADAVGDAAEPTGSGAVRGFELGNSATPITRSGAGVDQMHSSRAHRLRDAVVARRIAGLPHDRDRPWLVLDRTGHVALVTAVDLGGIGKGLALRWAAERLRHVLADAIRPGAGSTSFEAGPSFLLEAGGDLVAEGNAPEGGAWRIGIEDPRGGPAPLAVIALDRGAIATSSVAVNAWRDTADRPVHHLIDPSTGRPGGDGLLAVTVVGRDPAWTEVWSKALFLAGAAAIGPEARSRGLAAWWIDEEGVLRMTPAARPLTIWPG